MGTHPHSAHKSDTSFFFFLRGGLPAPAPEANMLVSRPNSLKRLCPSHSAHDIDPNRTKTSLLGRQPRSIQ